MPRRQRMAAPAREANSGMGRASAGFTLLETVVALAILGASLAVVLGLIGSGLGATQRAHTRTLLSELAHEQMEMLFLQREIAWGEDRGTFEPPFQQIRWHSRVAAGDVEGTVLLEVVVVGQRDSVHLASLRAR